MMAKNAVLLLLSITTIWIAASLASKYIINFESNSRSLKEFDLSITLGASLDHVVWFVQISDLHLSIFHDHKSLRSLEFEEFCKFTIPDIEPAVVLATGDLVDAKTADNIGSTQYSEEWEMYWRALNGSGVLEKTSWLDIRGNHDAFNVPYLKSDFNYFRSYSAQGRKDFQSSYHYIHRSGVDQYSFIAADFTPVPGFKRPYNFFGYNPESSSKVLENFAADSTKSNATIWFGHYPTSFIVSSSPGIKHIMKSGLAYMCGHLHTLFGIIPRMYSFQESGNLELEVGDWRENRIFRVAAIDHGLLSFIDVTHREWPVILITNPKNALYKMPWHEPLDRIISSTHIRVLVFSTSPLEHVRIRINNEEWRNASHSSGPLYVLPWNSTKYVHDLHSIQVFAQDAEGHQGSVSQQFSLDEKPTQDFAFLARLILMTNIVLLLQIAFGVFLALSVLPMCILRCFTTFSHSSTTCSPIKKFVYKIHLLSTIDILFYPLIVSALYVAVGPFFVGNLIDGYTGVCFIWGLYVKGASLPGDVTFTHGISHLALYHIPLVLCLANIVARRSKGLPLTLSRAIWQAIPLFFIFLLKGWFSFSLYLKLGVMAFLLSPLYLWSIIFGFVLLWRASVLQRQQFTLVLQQTLTDCIDDHKTAVD